MMIFAYFLFAQYDVFPSEVPGAGRRHHRADAVQRRGHRRDRPRRRQLACRAGRPRPPSALGMRWGQTMRSILLPQAITSMLPVLISQMVVVLKDTAIGYQITFVEMVRPGHPGRLVVRQLHPRADRDRGPDDQRQLHALGVRDLAGGPDAALRKGPAPLHIAPVTQGTFWPEMKPACALHRNAQAAPSSSGRPCRFAAIESACRRRASAKVMPSCSTAMLAIWIWMSTVDAFG